MSNLIVQGSEDNPITAQMIFNAAWQRFIIEQAPPAVRKVVDGPPIYVCAYLTPDGRKCAVGLCIPDGHTIQQSKTSLYGIANTSTYMKLFKLSTEEAQYLQGELHDDLINRQTGEWAYSLEDRKNLYLSVAKKYNLTIPE